MVAQRETTLYVKQHDTRPHLDVAIEDVEGYPINLTGASVTFSMRSAADQSTKVNAAASIILNATRGEARHQWSSSMTDTVGVFEGEFSVIDFENRVQTFPSNGFVTIIIVDSL